MFLRQAFRGSVCTVGAGPKAYSAANDLIHTQRSVGTERGRVEMDSNIYRQLPKCKTRGDTVLQFPRKTKSRYCAGIGI
jgi:hypothetical protein